MRRDSTQLSFDTDTGKTYVSNFIHVNTLNVWLSLNVCGRCKFYRQEFSVFPIVIQCFCYLIFFFIMKIVCLV